MSQSLTDALAQHVAQARASSWEGGLADYLELVRSNPAVSQLSHARIYAMIEAAGITTDADGKTTYHFFDDEIFGTDEAVEEIVAYYRAAAKRLEPRKRILLLMGPPGAGKSTVAALLKRRLEDYSMTDGGAVYAIEYPQEAGEEFAGRTCPMREEPLHAIPAVLRDAVMDDLGVHIEGDLCPLCRWVVDEALGGDFMKLRVRRVVLSEQKRSGIGLFHPHDPKSMDIADLVGSMNLSTVGEYGSEADPRAYSFDGEFNVSNRGVLELVEALKAPEEFLWLLLTLTQEQSIKAGRFPLIYADEAVIAHTNQAEYDAWLANPKSAALKDRTIQVRVPYNLRIDDEVRIYEKMLAGTTVAKDGVHLDPNALRLAASFSILTRLADSQKAGMDRVRKMKIYNGDDIANVRAKDIKELRDEAAKTDEGMRGISPRFVIDAVAAGLVAGDGRKCLTAIDTLRALRDALAAHPSVSAEERDAYLDFISTARREYDDVAKNEVRKAFVHSFDEQAETVLNNYLDHVSAAVSSEKLRDPITDEEVEPDEAMMKSIEDQIGITSSTAKAFREEILIKLSKMAREGKPFTWSSHPRLKEAIEAKLFADLKDLVRVTISATNPDKEQLARINEVAGTLMDKHGYCEVCAKSLLDYTATLLSKG